ncbi:unnamed protein product [Vitrella brassicaformis CCMP3155]|uniref:Uncharacterized protein n=1 Tax=Vitrella brassicaformis (strain CCMP3155) TaxID=1169540 RepID=A0A0G4FNK0_VITBC|nr:unnamed protein product [Vitrella brassicaformis CCMP3155]|eukprot:CEM15807.1 unnamed protein product [Vitrella brassicaformis CCMP3155]
MSASSARVLFPSFFTFACFAVFLWPLVQTIYLTTDVNFRYWVGYWMLICLALPVLYLATYVMHLVRTRPSRSLILASFIASSCLFIVLGVALLLYSSGLGDQLLSTDCATWKRTRPLEQTYQDARELYACCLSEHGDNSLSQYCPAPATATATSPTANGTSSSNGRQDILVTECDRYEDLYNDHKGDLAYLAYLETSYYCSGFCTVAERPLFTRTLQGNDACAEAVASVIRSKVDFHAVQMISYGGITLVLFLAWLGFTNKTLRFLSRDQSPLY